MNIVTTLHKRIKLYKEVRERSVYKPSYFSLVLWDIVRLLRLKFLYKRFQMNWRKGTITYLSKYLNSEDDFNFAKIEHKQNYNEVIWVSWFQGEENAPDVVQKCIKSIRRHSNGHQVILIDDINIREIIAIPNHIYEKLSSGAITKTHFSDILRVSLLSKYGGFWLDATTFVSEDIPEFIFEQEFWSVKGEKYEYGNLGSLYRWSVFCMASKPGNKLMKRTMEILYAYWFHEEKNINYFIVDYVMSLLYETDDEIRRMVDSVKPSNYHLHSLQLNANALYTEKLYKEIFSGTMFHKLSYKIDISDNPDSLLNHVLK